MRESDKLIMWFIIVSILTFALTLIGMAVGISISQ